MYRHCWFNKKTYIKDISLKNDIPSDWMQINKNDGIFVSAWEEHCLECSVPQCYHNCVYWVERTDRKCQKTFYGIKKRTDLSKSFPFAVQLQFRPWGKIESSIYNRYLSSRKKILIQNFFRRFEKIIRNISNSIVWLTPTYKLCGAFEVYKQKAVRHFGIKKEPKKYLFQCYSESEKYNLFFELADDKSVFFRTSFQIKTGYNQFIVDIPNIDLKNRKLPLMRYYPENNINAELLVLFSDFIYDENENNIVRLPAAKVKCVIWDLDNTIWDGILIESNPSELQLRQSVLETIQKLDEKGIINVIVSKNNETDVIPVLKRLGIFDYFVYVVANWNRKSQNIKELAKLLNINANTFAFIDDSDFERKEVHSELPEVRLYDENSFPKMLSFPEFDVVVTEDSKNRRKMYQTEAKRHQVKKDFIGNDIEFLKSCKISITIELVNDETEKRCYELVQRTNQLNLSGTKYDESAFHELIISNRKNVLAIHCEDAYGSYGLVGFVLFMNDQGITRITEYAMSCRVAQKWIEPALLHYFINKFSTQQIIFEGIYNKKNDLLINTLKAFGLENQSDSSEKLLLTIGKHKINFEEVVQVIDKVID